MDFAWRTRDVLHGWNNACVNWCHDGWSLYASGYKEAADLLVQNAGQDKLAKYDLVKRWTSLDIGHLTTAPRQCNEGAEVSNGSNV